MGPGRCAGLRCFAGAGGVCLPRMLAGGAPSRAGPRPVLVPRPPASGSLTTGPVLASTKLPLRTWFLAMHLMTQAKNGMSAPELSRQLSVSNDVLWKVGHKLVQVMKERADTRPLGGSVQIDDAYRGGEHRGGKRGGRAPRRTPFGAAVERKREGRPARMRPSRVGAFRGDDVATRARCHLEPGAVVLSDALGCLGAAKHAGCFTGAFVAGSGAPVARDRAPTRISTIPGSIRRSLPGTNHRPGSRHLPRYRAEPCRRLNRRFSVRERFPRLAYAAPRISPMPCRVRKLAETNARSGWNLAAEVGRRGRKPVAASPHSGL